jgi:hypothetical protein
MIRLQDSNIILYLKRENINIDFKDSNDLEKYFEDLFKKLKSKIDIVGGFYLVHVFIDKYYGVVVEIKNEDFDYYYDQIDMQLLLKEVDFLYKIDDYLILPKSINKKISIYHYKNNYYLKIEEELNSKEMLELMEYSEIIYKTEDILRYGKKMKQNSHFML